MRKPAIRNRSFQSHGAGKGSADRTTDDAAYRKNFDQIKWGTKEPIFVDNDYVGVWDFIRSK